MGDWADWMRSELGSRRSSGWGLLDKAPGVAAFVWGLLTWNGHAVTGAPELAVGAVLAGVGVALVVFTRWTEAWAAGTVALAGWGAGTAVDVLWPSGGHALGAAAAFGLAALCVLWLGAADGSGRLAVPGWRSLLPAGLFLAIAATALSWQHLSSGAVYAVAILALGAMGAISALVTSNPVYRWPWAVVAAGIVVIGLPAGLGWLGAAIAAGCVAAVGITALVAIALRRRAALRRRDAHP
jgi:hypothetical protein